MVLSLANWTVSPHRFQVSARDMNVPGFADATRNEIANVADGGPNGRMVVDMAAPSEQGVFIEGVQEHTASSIEEIGIGG